MNHFYAVIMAGGSGTRLWPISRQSHPKHALPILGDFTLFQSTIKRLAGLFEVENVIVVTTQGQFTQLREQALEIPSENFLLEPEPRGTASVVGLAASMIQRRDPDAVMAVLPSDHFIRNTDLFHYIINTAFKVAEIGYLVTLGITPTFPSTGYGYIQRGEPIPEEFPYPVYSVLKFKEKPDEIQAREMIAQRDHSWNSGMFIWRTDRILDEISKQMPKLKDELDKIVFEKDTHIFDQEFTNIWSGLSIETIDYGIMENASKVAVLPATGLEWSDVGSWDSLFGILLPDENGNIILNENNIAIKTHSSLIYGNKDDKLVVTIGVDDLIIVDSGDVLLICKKDYAQQVRQAVSHLKDTKQDRYL